MYRVGLIADQFLEISKITNIKFSREQPHGVIYVVIGYGSRITSILSFKLKKSNSEVNRVAAASPMLNSLLVQTNNEMGK